jgi:hypothetical protein
MFIKKTDVPPTDLEIAIARLHMFLAKNDPDTEEYAAIADNLVKLHNLKEAEKLPMLSPDTIATIAAHLIGVVMILKYEQANVFASKAAQFLVKLR